MDKMTKMKKYQTIVVDPPWKYGKWGRATPEKRPNGHEYDMPYPTMTIQEITDIPIENLSAINCDLYLWTTQKYLPSVFGIIKAWGFKYCQTLTYCKAPRGIGQGGLFCPTTEFLILGRKGTMPKNKRRVDSTWWQVKRPHNQHSKKPEFFQDIIEKVSNPPRLELFARRKRTNWAVWGNEVESDESITKALL